MENYRELRARADTNAAGLRVLDKLIDVDRAVAQLPYALKQVVVLHGIHDLRQEELADALHVARQTIARRYEEGLAWTHFYMNGGFIF